MFFSILFSQILIQLNFYKYIPQFIKNIFIKLFNLNNNEVSIFLLSIISGYPNNSKMLNYNKNQENQSSGCIHGRSFQRYDNRHEPLPERHNKHQ